MNRMLSPGSDALRHTPTYFQMKISWCTQNGWFPLCVASKLKEWMSFDFQWSPASMIRSGARRPRMNVKPRIASHFVYDHRHCAYKIPRSVSRSRLHIMSTALCRSHDTNICMLREPMGAFFAFSRLTMYSNSKIMQPGTMLSLAVRPYLLKVLQPVRCRELWRLTCTSTSSSGEKESAGPKCGFLSTSAQHY